MLEGIGGEAMGTGALEDGMSESKEDGARAYCSYLNGQVSRASSYTILDLTDVKKLLQSQSHVLSTFTLLHSFCVHMLP
jgi:hypothetical protein